MKQKVDLRTVVLAKKASNKEITVPTSLYITHSSSVPSEGHSANPPHLVLQEQNIVSTTVQTVSCCIDLSITVINKRPFNHCQTVSETVRVRQLCYVQVSLHLGDMEEALGLVPRSCVRNLLSSYHALDRCFSKGFESGLGRPLS